MNTNQSFLANKLSLDDINFSINKNPDLFVKNFFQMQFSWMTGGYKIFRDLDKYLIIVHLINKTFSTYNKYFLNFSFEKFYSNENIEVEKISIINIVKELNLSKETSRRKLNELSSEGFITRKSKKITINNKAFTYQKPNETLKNLCKLLKIVSQKLQKNEELNSFSTHDFEEKIKKNYTRYWNAFLNFQISYMVSGKKFFGDYESFMCIGICALNQSFNLINKQNHKAENISDIADSLAQLEISKGLNPTTISDLTGIPRATVIRKLQVLLRKKFLNKNEKNLFNLSSPQKNSQAYNLLKNRFYHHQLQIRNLITEILNYTKV
tara:strand:+ start:4855 stop:5826 length:972 start_codon:yes stop_codon:yes gene_type:complete